MKIKLSATLILMILAAAFAFAQSNIKPNQTVSFSLKPEESKIFLLNLKKDDYAESVIGGTDEAYVEFTITAPSGIKITDSEPSSPDSFPFVALESGEYQVKITRGKEEGEAAAHTFNFKYGDKFVLPANSKVKDSRKINGYDTKIYEDRAEDGNTYLLIEKSGKLKYVAKSGKTIGGFSFPDAGITDADKVTKTSASLFRATADKTGDGAPDLAVENYSGGAHCCFSTYFFELGDDFKVVPALDTGDATTVAIGKMPDGSLKLATGDASFAYWNTSFAGSPIPEVILSFRDGAFRSDAKLMAKPAPALAKLKAAAAAFRRKMSAAPYTGETGDNSFDEAFWGKMLELIYSGHEDLAYQYLEWAWKPTKKGKELFKKDFAEQLSKSQFYQDYLTSK